MTTAAGTTEASSQPPAAILADRAKVSINDDIYATTLTYPSDLPGVIILADSLQRCEAKFPLLVLISLSLPAVAVHALRVEAAYNSSIQLRTIKPYQVSTTESGEGDENRSASAGSDDLFAKLQVFSLVEFRRIVHIDPAVMGLSSPDELFSLDFPAGKSMLASTIHHVNQGPGKDVSSSENLPISPIAPGITSTGELCGDVLVFEPREEMWRDLMQAYESDRAFPGHANTDQTFFSSFFIDKWEILNPDPDTVGDFQALHSDESLITLPGDRKTVFLSYNGRTPWLSLPVSHEAASRDGSSQSKNKRWWDAYKIWRSERLSAVRGSKESLQKGLAGKEAAKEEVNILLNVVERYMDMDSEQERYLSN